MKIKRHGVSMQETLRKVLVVEDEEKISSVLKSFLESKGFFVIIASDGLQALELFDELDISLILLDLMLPKLSGEEVCKIIRGKSKVPIIMLTAKSDEVNTLQGLGIGADDYIHKPFSFKALYARIEAVLRRADNDFKPQLPISVYQDGDLTVDLKNSKVRKKEQEINLTPYEYKLLITLMRYPKKVFTRDELIEVAFGSEYEGFDRAIDSHIKNLRQKIENDPKKPEYVITVHGIGYKFGGD